MEQIPNKDWSKFEIIDPFNPENLVSGCISHHSSDDYGALYIERVNNTKVPQLRLCTPKLRYPFDTNGKWHFPKAKEIQRYEKIDGTNIYAYSYQNEKGKEFISYKLRIQPFIKNSKFGPFLEMWEEILKKQLPIELLVRKLVSQGYGISFELWGAKNLHLIKYEYPLKASLLFVRKGQKILPPKEIQELIPKDIIAPFRGVIDKDYIWNYKEAQKDLEASLKKTEDGYTGQEGEVWYLLDETGNWCLYKCKSETIENIHWSQGGIGKNIIIATCQNAFENWDNPTIEQVKELLKEEFTEPEIEKVHYSIIKHLGEVKKTNEFKLLVLEEYNKLGMNILDNKISVLRALSRKFKKDEMKRVYSVIFANVVK